MTDMWANYRSSRDSLFNTLDQKRQEKRQAEIDALNRQAAEQQLGLGQLKMGQLQQQVQDQSARRALETRLAEGTPETVTNPDRVAFEYDPAQGPVLPPPESITRNVPVSPLAALQARTSLALQQGDTEGAKRIVDVSDKIRGTENEIKSREFFEAASQGRGEQYLAANGKDPAMMKGVTLTPDGFITDAGEQGKIITTFGRDGINVKHVQGGTPAAPPKKSWIDVNGQKMQLDERGEPTGKSLGSVRETGGGGGHGAVGNYPRVAQLMADGWYPSSGRVTEPLLKIMEAAAEVAEQRGTPFGPDEARAAEFNSVKNRATGSSGGSRLVIARKQNIEAANGLLADLDKTAQKLDYSDIKLAGMLEKFKNGQLNDPVYTEYMTQRADALFVLANALKQNGVTDKSIEVEEEAFTPTLSGTAFKGWLNTQRRALNRSAAEMQKDYKFNMEQQPVFDAGQGGAPTGAQPVPGVQDDLRPKPSAAPKGQLIRNPKTGATGYLQPDGSILSETGERIQ